MPCPASKEVWDSGIYARKPQSYPNLSCCCSYCSSVWDEALLGDWSGVRGAGFGGGCTVMGALLPVCSLTNQVWANLQSKRQSFLENCLVRAGLGLSPVGNSKSRVPRAEYPNFPLHLKKSAVNK